MGPARRIIHIDMDCFYAAVEMRDDPSLKTLPIAVGGNPEKRGVVATANYEARKFGVRSALSSAKALQLCPQLVIVPPTFKKYKRESRKIREVFKKFTDLIEPLSLDEAFLDVSDCAEFAGDPVKIAFEIKRLIQQETQLTASAGVAPNKFVAKIASDLKKPDGLVVVQQDEILDFMKPLAVNKIFGVGKVSAKKLNEKGIFTCGELQNKTKQELQENFGRFGAQLYHLCRGEDNREVITEHDRKSLSVENTFATDMTTESACLHRLKRLYDELLRRLDRARLDQPVRGLFVKIKYADFQQTTHENCEFTEVKYDSFVELFKNCYKRRPDPIRLLGMGVRLWTNEEQKSQQMTFHF
jgi:DNA polymerase-4